MINVLREIVAHVFVSRFSKYSGVYGQKLFIPLEQRHGSIN